MSRRPGQKNCLLHVPIHSSEEYKVLKEYSKNYAAQRPHKDNAAHYGGKTKRDKSVKFDMRVKEEKIMEYCDTVPKKKKEKNYPKSARVKASR